MKLRRVIAAGLRRVPADLKATVTFAEPGTADLVVVPGVVIVPDGVDTHRGPAQQRSRPRRLVVPAAALGAFVPREGQTATWGGVVRTVVSATPAPEGAPAVWRVQVTR